MIARLNTYEEATIEQVLKGFGFFLEGGSVEISGDGESTTLHVAINRGCAGNSNDQQLGEQLKNALEVDRVYNEGIQIA